MKKSSSSNSFVDQASDVDDHPSLMDMYARQLGVAAEKGGRDIPSGSPPPPDTSNNQQDEGQQQPTVYHDDPSERQVEPAVVGVSDKTGFISQNDTGNKHKGSNRFFSSLSKVASSAKSMVGKIAASSSSSSAASAYFNPNAQISLANLSGEQRNIIKQLDVQNTEMGLLISRFNEISESGNGLMNSQVKLERFVIHMIKRGHDPLWADAAFRSFDSNKDGDIPFIEFVMADVSLRLEDSYVNNDMWLDLRRNVVFTVYDREVKGSLGRKELVDILSDMSLSDKNPNIFGIRNELWSDRHEENKSLIADEYSSQILSQELAVAKLDVAQRDFQFEELHLKYLKLEKAVVDYKYENAKLRAELDEYKRVRDVRTIDLNGMEDSLFENDNDDSDEEYDDGKDCHENIDRYDHEYDEDEGTGTAVGGNNVKTFHLSASSRGNSHINSFHVAMNEVKGPLMTNNPNGFDKGGKYIATNTGE